jgi:non-specific serine/threonine protein kinase
MAPPLVRLTPQGHLRLRSKELEALDLPSQAKKALLQAFSKSSGELLLELGASLPGSPLPPDLGFFRDLGKLFLTHLCSTPDEVHRVTPRPGEFLSLLQRAPPLHGGEYLREEVLKDLWSELQETATEAIEEAGGKLAAFLKIRAPSWHQVGRIHLHLAEKKLDPVTPFAFLATYTEGLTAAGKTRHIPLGKALKSYSEAQNRHGLKALLQPVQRAAQKSPLVAELLENGDLFHPLAWDPRQAYAFLRELPVLEESGVVTRVPNWWKARPRVRVQARVGQETPSRLGLNALLDFSVDLSLNGEPLTQKERDQLLAGNRGLILLKGQWVEADPERIQDLLGRWEELEGARSEGLTLAESMRFLAGADLGGAEGEVLGEGVEDWSERVAGKWLQDALSRLRGEGKAVEKKLSRILQATLRPYQALGVRWLHALAELGLGACLADDMGLGKTLQVLALLLLRRKKRRGPHLLVLPASLLANWTSEIQRFAPSLKTLVAHSSVTPRKELLQLTPEEASRQEVILTSYGTVGRLKWLQEISWDTVVLDEAQAIKNPGTKVARAVKKLRAGRRVVMTGTPVENRLGDLWSLFDFLNPGLLGSSKNFASFTKAHRNLGPNRYRSLRRLLNPYILRRLKTDPEVAPDLPNKTEMRAYCGLTKRQVVLYEEAVGALAKLLKEKQGIERRGVVLAFMLRFQQICNHPSQWLGDEEYLPKDSGKLHRLRELAEVVAARQEKMLVFTRFRSIIEPLARFLGDIFSRKGLTLHGGTPVKKRGGLVEAFQEEDGPPFFILSLKAGGTGLNLTAANHVVHFDRWWNPAVEAQATDRAFRIGQTRNVLVHKLICRGTIEERIDDLLRDKKALAKELLGAKEEGVGKVLTELEDQELMDLVRLDLRTASEELTPTQRRKTRPS